MGKRPSKEHSLDRIDFNGDYEPGNCRWATRLEQHRNTRKNRYISYKGETLTLSQWVIRTGIKYRTLHARLTDYGWSVERALTTKGKQYE